MNIMIINWRDMGNPLYGGAEIHMVEIAKYLALKHNVHYVTSMYKGAQKHSIEDNVHYIRIGDELTFNFSVMMRMMNLLEKIRPDIILEDINKVPFFSPLFTKKPVLAVIPHIFGKSIFNQANPLIASYVYLMEKPIKHVFRHSYYEVISQSTKQDLVKRGMKAERISVIECGVDNEFAYMRNESKFSTPVITYIGRLKKYKSIEHIIQAMPELRKQFPDIRLLIAGKGDYEGMLRDITEKAKLSDAVEFLGYISEEEKWRLLRKSWLSVYPSMIEGWGIVNIEANLMRTPVVCADVPGLRDSVKNGYSGILYKWGDISHMTEKIAHILDKDVYENYSENAYEWAKRFTWENTGIRTEKLIEHILDIA